MAYNASNDVQTIVSTLDKNQRGDKIQVAKIENKETKAVSIDVRNMYTDESGEVRPTSKGIRISTELAVEVIDSMIRAGGMEVLSEVKERLNEIEQDM